MNTQEKPVASPCVSLCALDEDDLCVGCQRSADEIRRWGLMGNEERREVLQRCSERLRLSGQLM
ncbi:DUF1289 domain-containing protein [Stutzerimonas stutzeri]|uniref:DUF1289 domain-containing protein n=1 Tax=Stutzerimonas stutzeri TaxID=316 RepID=A0A2N8RB68_STUST|nr:DUF1289 domain-containing protein [Stutzerimonas stutzeri]KRW70779.1 Fe-S protein [Pseudomonas sp. TTU2014-105ASC]MDH2243437.1 DUF1289 domain-containing protein [Pseudomonas sp. GD03909]MDH2245324.1 DUF1289 domain-containing protein [Pseudomonas sp. GD03856]MDH2264418.1 DUF1289 domain-containing protein [Pseudomonas sp. GD03855]EHY77832.1 Fe-S protein [Stutzerimonas stutzeri ATCC 14405 = CCUG 16156]